MKLLEYKNLSVWKSGQLLSLAIYNQTLRYPKHETFGLIRQMRKASIVFISNIAEGYCQNNIKDKLLCLSEAKHALYEVEVQILISKDLGYIENDTTKMLLTQSNRCKVLLEKFTKDQL